MAIKEHHLWDLFDKSWKKYVEPTTKLCFDLANGALSNTAFGARLGSILRDPKIDKSKEAFFWLGKAFIERTQPEPKTNPLQDNLLRKAVDLADEFCAELRQFRDSPVADQARVIAKTYKSRFTAISVQELKKEVELAWKLAVGQREPGGAIKVARAKRRNGRKNTIPGDAEAKIVSALCKHHNYDNGGCLNMEPATWAELAEVAGVVPSSITNFFRRKLALGTLELPHHGYQRICRNGSIPRKLRSWLDEPLRRRP